MDYMQGVVEDFLTAGQRLFIIPECLIKLDDGDPVTGRHWYCDVAAVDVKAERVYLCEVTYAKKPEALHKRLRAWAGEWAGVCRALERDYGIASSWEVQPRVFVLEACEAAVLSRAREGIAATASAMPEPEVWSLEEAAKWRLASLESLPPES